MRVIFASETPVLPEESRFQVDTAEDNHRFERRWVVPIKPRLEMEKRDPPSDWAVVSKIVTAVSWNMRMDASVRKASEGNSMVAYMHFPKRGGSYGQVKRLLHLFGNRIGVHNPFLEIKLGASNRIRFVDYYDFDDVDLTDGIVDEKLTENEALTLLTTTDKDVQITWVESFHFPEADAISTCVRILDTGYFADCHLVSNQDQDTPCHQVILKDNGTKFKEEIASGNARIKVDLSTHGVGVLLRFIYCGTLDDATGNWKLSMELLKVAHSLGIHKLWVAIVGILREMEEPDMKTAVEVFQILVNSGKLKTNKDLARKLVRILAKKSNEDVGDRAILHEYIRDRPFFDAWMGFTSAF